MILSEVEETIYVVDADEASGDNVVRVRPAIRLSSRASN